MRTRNELLEAQLLNELKEERKGELNKFMQKYDTFSKKKYGDDLDAASLKLVNELFGVKESKDKQEGSSEGDAFEEGAMLNGSEEQVSLRSLNEAMYNLKKYESQRDLSDTLASDQLRSVEEMAGQITQLRRQ